MVQLRRSGGEWGARAFLTARIPDMKNGREEIIRKLREARRRAPFSGRKVVASMPADQVDIFPVQLALGEDEGLDDAVLREARSYLTYDMEDAVIDYLVLREERYGTEAKARVKLLLISARREHVENYLAVLKGAGLLPVALDIPSCALARVFRFAGDTEKNLLLVHMDEKYTTLTILSGGSIVLERNLPLGRETTAERLVEQLRLDSRKSGDLLKRVGLFSFRSDPSASLPEAAPVSGHTAETVCELITPEMETLAREVKKVMIYFSSERRGEPIHELRLLGACGEIRYLDRFMKTRIGIPVQGFVPSFLRVPEEKGDVEAGRKVRASLSSVALGLALRGCEEFSEKSVKDIADVAV